MGKNSHFQAEKEGLQERRPKNTQRSMNILEEDELIMGNESLGN